MYHLTAIYNTILSSIQVAAILEYIYSSCDFNLYKTSSTFKLFSLAIFSMPSLLIRNIQLAGEDPEGYRGQVPLPSSLNKNRIEIF